MKRVLLMLVSFGLATYGFSQDNLLMQDFQGFDEGGDIPFIEEVDDAEAEDWLSLDLDNLLDGSGGDRPGNWYGSLDFYYSADGVEAPEDTNFVMASSSWMEGFAPGNRNLLITPEIDVPADGTYILNWESGVFQTPRYADGYSVWVTPDANILDGVDNFTDKLFQHAQMVEEVGWVADYYPGIDYAGCSAGNEFDVDAYCWFPETLGSGTDGVSGYTHANGHTDTNYLFENGTSWVGLLEPHAVDLSAYAGETIRIGFLHDSDDDNLIMVDNISVDLFTSVDEYDFDNIITMYPNPADDRLTLNFSTIVKNQAIVSIYDGSGRLVMNESYNDAQLRAFQTLDVSDLATGVYSIQIAVDEAGVTGSTFMKK